MKLQCPNCKSYHTTNYKTMAAYYLILGLFVLFPGWVIAIIPGQTKIIEYVGLAICAGSIIFMILFSGDAGMCNECHYKIN